ncbi:SpoIIE family protein phosphatase [Sulfuritalea hydrogenivorans]|uniref:Protein serine/threonine phosphatase n=1 Tax=Sulfuritalea hydrogenivorans sk43H TaxID=1223802 RepID=W0SDY7_9PROT|nr:SpoIIE family protein phosphatase [Sulfuritalea hydrogenivorans]BAO29152.1 protein serine/threonine phosphatase [Sulfuritalea hydrogenivorans sk43H]
MSALALAALHPASTANAASSRQNALTASLLLPLPAASPNQTNDEVFGIFDSAPNLSALPVTEDDRPIGLINRNIFMDSFARPFHREVYGRKSCIAFMDKQPLIVDGGMSIQDLSFRVVEKGGKTLNDGFVITIDGRYAGMGTGQDLVRAIAGLQAEKNRIVMESIDYASVIQRSFLRPSREALRSQLPDHLLLWEPRDLVGGDYFYCRRFDDGFFLTLFDCTGHGVPGAFMTLIMASFIDHALTNENRHDPAAVMAEVNQRVKSALGQIDHSHKSAASNDELEHRSDDGMDAAFCWVATAERRIIYAGAHSPLILLRPGEDIELIEGDRAGVGYASTPMDQTWQNHCHPVPPGTAVFLATDGLVDQPGGPKRIAFGKKRLCALLAEHRNASALAPLRAVVLKALEDYQGTETRRDDVGLIGFRL